ncbi:MFS transporter [Actinomadura sp. NEAU-AAG7]|uniref:MFS transporter n=1 Tax=Actinomadura sp. NEAU-AAG7 TaxID=2839640 RepID=UPI001BE404DD|nr:MFS transporter [Actinomadura sp. NEAU-AAG7]MBT2210894.1 MFS transporter [Actinomadura sp. NEAU-AAG7]
MRTYRELFATPEYTPLFLVVAAHVAATTVSGLALSTLVFDRTGSPLLSALAMFGPSLAQAAGAATLLSAADRLPPRAALTGIALLLALGTAAQAVPGLPTWAAFGVLLAAGMAGSLGGGVRYGLLTDILAREGYLLGRSVLAMTDGVMQICGFAVGGGLVAALSPRGTLLAGAALFCAAAGTARLGLAARPARAAGRPSVRATWRRNARLWSLPARRHVYLALWVPSGLVVGCESLFVSYAPRQAGLLFTCSALGMLAGDTTVGRFVPDAWRGRLVVPLYVLLAAPYLVFAAGPPLPVAAAAVTVASAGYGTGLLLQPRLMDLTPDEMSGQALGLHSSGMLAAQGVAAALAGTLAQWSSPGTATALMAGLSLAATAAVARALRAPHDTVSGHSAS